MLNRTDSNKDLQEIGAANYAVLERIRVNRREDHLKVSQCNKQSFNWQSVRKWIRKFYRISSHAQKWADFVLQINFILWFVHQFFQPRALLKTYWIYNNVEEALPNGSKHLVNSRKFALKYVLGPDSLHALLQEIQFLFCLTETVFPVQIDLCRPLRKQKITSTGWKGHGLWFVIGGFWSILCVSVFQGSLLLNFRVLAIKFFFPSYYWNEASLDCQGEIIHECRASKSRRNSDIGGWKQIVHFHQHLIIGASAHYCCNIWQAMTGHYGNVWLTSKKNPKFWNILKNAGCLLSKRAVIQPYKKRSFESYNFFYFKSFLCCFFYAREQYVVQFKQLTG